MFRPPKNGGISMTFTNAFYIETIFESFQETLRNLGQPFAAPSTKHEE